MITIPTSLLDSGILGYLVINLGILIIVSNRLEVIKTIDGKQSKVAIRAKTRSNGLLLIKYSTTLV